MPTVDGYDSARIQRVAEVAAGAEKRADRPLMASVRRRTTASTPHTSSSIQPSR